MENEFCKNCDSQRCMKIVAKSNDLNSVTINTKTYKNLYVPEDMGIGGGDYISFMCCLDCGQIQGEWPVPETDLETLYRLSEDLGIKEN